jgi:hypothetical protein
VEWELRESGVGGVGLYRRWAGVHRGCGQWMGVREATTNGCESADVWVVLGRDVTQRTSAGWECRAG